MADRYRVSPIATRIEAHPNGWRNPFDRFEVGAIVRLSNYENHRIEAKGYWNSGDTRYLLSHLGWGRESWCCRWESCRYCTSPGEKMLLPVTRRELEPLWHGGRGNE